MTDQIRRWTGDFGREYTDRNDYTPALRDEFYGKTYGATRRELNQPFLQVVPKDVRILEVGCNMVTQLLLLKEMGFTDLSGVEIQSYALQRAKERLGDAQILSASARLYLDTFADLELVREEHIPYLETENADTIFLLRRKVQTLHRE